MRHVKIYIDTREDKKSVDQFIEEIIEDMLFEKSQMTTGDYAIEVNGKIEMIIERKTWKDLAGSIRDERILDQVKHMIEARNTCGCHLIFLIEGGTVFHNPDKCIAKMSVKNMMAKLRHMLIRDNIPWVHSRSPEHSAEVIVDFARDYANIYPPINDVPITGGSELLHKKHDNSRRETLNMWSVLPGIGKKSAHAFCQFSIADVISGQVDDKLANLKTVSGRPIDGIHAKNCLLDTTIAVKVLAEIGGVTESSASKLLNCATLIELASSDADIHKRIAETSLNDKRKIGPAIVKKVNAALTRHIDKSTNT